MPGTDIHGIYGYYIISSVLHSTGLEDTNLKSGLFKQDWTQSLSLYLFPIYLPFFSIPTSTFSLFVKLPFSFHASRPLKDLPQYLAGYTQVHVQSSEGAPRQGEESATRRLRSEKGGQKEKQTKKWGFSPVTHCCNIQRTKIRFMEAVWGGGKERKRGGCTLAKRNAHWWSRTFIPMVCTKQMMCVWGNHPLHLLTCIDMHILLLVDLALMEAMWYKLHFNNTTALWKNYW